MTTDYGPGVVDAIEAARAAADMTGPAYSVEHVGLPSPDFPAVAATRRVYVAGRDAPLPPPPSPASAQPVEQLVPLGTQIRRIIHTRSAGQLTTEQATRAILNAVIDVLPLPDGAVDAEAWGENAADHDRPPTAAGYLEYLLDRLRAANGPTYSPPLTISASASALEIGTVEVGAEVAFSIQTPGDGRAEIDLFYIVGDTVEVVGLPLAKAAQLRDLLTAALDLIPPGSGDAPAGDMAVAPAGAPDFNLGPVDEGCVFDAWGADSGVATGARCLNDDPEHQREQHSPVVEQDPDALDQLGVAASDETELAALMPELSSLGAPEDLPEQCDECESRGVNCRAHRIVRPDADGDLIAPAKEA